jgi:hypothetical protein
VLVQQLQSVEIRHAMLRQFVIAMAIIAILGMASDARAYGEKERTCRDWWQSSRRDLAFGDGPDNHHHGLQRLQSGAAHIDLGVGGYGCNSHSGMLDGGLVIFTSQGRFTTFARVICSSSVLLTSFRDILRPYTLAAAIKTPT